MSGEIKKWRTGKSEKGYGDPGILLLDGDMDRVLSVTKQDDGQIQFMEECDGYFRLKCSKEDALAVVEELKAWIEAT